MLFKPRTRRQQIERERRSEWIQFILLVALTVAVIAVGAVSCARRTEAKKDIQSGFADTSSTDATKQAEDPSHMTEADIEFLMSLDSYPRLINASNSLPADFAPKKTTRLYGLPDGVEVMLEFDTAVAFYDLCDAMNADGLGIIPLSGYRTYEQQVSIFNYNVQLHSGEGMSPEESWEYTAKFVAFPGTSEHQYGKAIDVTIDGTTNHTFNETDQGKWLIDNAHKFGFVVRYPFDKVDITGINYEPWHLRFVGINHATFMHEHGLCLEEYIEVVKMYNPDAVSQS